MNGDLRLSNITDIPQSRCFLAIVHQRNYTCKLIKSVDLDKPLVNQRLGCYSCEAKLNNRYTKIPHNDYVFSYEVFHDEYVGNCLSSAKSMAYCGHIDEETMQVLDNRIEEFWIHISKLRHKEQLPIWLKSQFKAHYDPAGFSILIP